MRTRTSPSLPPLLGFGGKLQSGKDAVADYLVERHGFVKVNMSDPIDLFAGAVNPIIDAVVHLTRKPGLLGLLRPRSIEVELIRYQDLRAQVGFTEAKKHAEFRGTLMRVGYEGGRQVIDDNIWTDKAAQTIASHRASGHGVVLSGVRFDNEQDLIRGAGGTLVWVDRPGLTATVNAGHATENGLDPDTFDLRLANTGTLDDLYAKADELLSAVTR